MYLPFCRLPLSLFFLPFLGSDSAVRAARESTLHASPQGRALPVQASPAPVDSFNDSAISATTIHVETSAGNTVDIRCDARLYGAGLNPTSCFGALNLSPTGEVQESWGYTPSAQTDVTLPVKLFSSKFMSSRLNMMLRWPSD